MKMEAAGSSEMWLSIYQITSQKAITLMLNRHANLVSHTGQLSSSPYNVPWKHRWLVEFETIALTLLIIKPTRWTNSLNLFLEWNSTCFGQCLCPSSAASSSRAVSKRVWHIPLLCVQWKTPNDWQRNCPKHVEFIPKINLRNWWENVTEEAMKVIKRNFIRIYHDARSPELQICFNLSAPEYFFFNFSTPSI